MQLPKIIAHRGAPAFKPENTLISLREAKALGATFVEFDVMLTEDGVPVIIHDTKVNRTTNGKGLVRQFTYAELAKLDAGEGEKIPTLEEWLTVAAQLEMGINIEIKESVANATAIATVVKRTLQSIWPHTMPAPLISSGTYRCLEVYRQLDPEAQLAFIVDGLPLGWRSKLAAIQACGLVVNHKRINAKKISTLHAAGYQVLAYTVNDSDCAHQLFAAGVDAIFTDDLTAVKQPTS